MMLRYLGQEPIYGVAMEEDWDQIAAIEAADIVIMNDAPSQIATAI